MIVVHHLQNQLGRLGLPQAEWYALPAGVDIFFVISGFIIWVTTASRPERTALAFYRDRVTRIVPLYWAMTMILAAVLVAAPGAASSAVLDASHLAWSFFFIPAVHPTTQLYQPTLIPGWTLNLEMFFYAIFGAAMAASGASLRLRCSIVVLTLIAVATAGYVVPLGGVAAFYAQDILAEFALGILIGVAFMERRLVKSNWFWIPLGLGVALLVAQTPLIEAESRLFRWGLPSALIVLGAVFVPQSGPVILQWLGDWSYALYLSHPITLAASEKFWKAAGGLPHLLFPAFALAVAILAAWIIHRTAEIPMSRMARQLMPSRPKTIPHPRLKESS
jgi:peptidoglycan/LPS O-acetylase OafA/YrhL